MKSACTIAGLAACAACLPLTIHAQTLTIIEEQQEVATIEIAAGVPLTIFGEQSWQSADGKVMHYSGKVRAEIRGEGFPVVVQAEELDFRP
jgi:hypothetical protein